MPCFYTYAQGWETAPAQRVFIAVPSYDGKIEPVALIAIMRGMELLRSEGIACEFSLLEGDCHVDDARNGMVSAFLESDCTDMVFVDADVGFRPENLLRLVRHKADLVAGVYPKKQEEVEFPVWPLEGDRTPTDDWLIEVIGAPTGFMRISRAAIEQLVEIHKGRTFQSQGGRTIPLLFERTFDEGRRWSGDYSFCRKWRAAGGKVYIDPEMDFAHVGPHAWTGRLGDHWRRELGEEPARFIEALERIKTGDPKIPEDFVTLHEAWGNPWAASPGFLIAAYQMARNAAGPVLETGSGLSTLVMAAAGAEVTTVEHDLGHYRRIVDRLARYDLLGEGVAIVYAPLDADGWYSFEPEGEFALLVVDGPPRHLADRGRIFEHAAARDADWLIDDAETAPGREFQVVEGEKPFVIAKRPADGDQHL